MLNWLRMQPRRWRNSVLADRRNGHPFDIALLDMQMPVVSGEELGQRIKADKALRETRLVMITSLGERGDAQRLLHIGFAGYLSKPVRREQLRRCLETVLSYSEAQPADDQPLVTSHILGEQRKGCRRILVVEDNPVNRKVARGMIEKLGFSVEMACNGQEALEALRGSLFDLVIMDCQMPEMDGYEATARLRNPVYGALRSNIPVIAMTANAMKGDREKCLKAGMDDYVSKPVNPPELAAVIERWLDRIASDFKDRSNSRRACRSGKEGNPSAAAMLPALEQVGLQSRRFARSSVGGSGAGNSGGSIIRPGDSEPDDRVPAGNGRSGCGRRATAGAQHKGRVRQCCLSAFAGDCPSRRISLP